MHLIIGTAGHIDHGKTSLVKALTGQDTDRLKEEKERGISIELGFAHLDLPDGTRAGVVDVPGHERFVRTMLAGAHGIDVVLFTVAADDGVMPQTEEHLDIIHLLDVTRAVFVITKTDLVPRARVGEVEDEIRILIEGTALEGSPIVPFSFVTDDGLDQVRAELTRALRLDSAHRADGYFRLPVDRVFVLQGHGVIVTGTSLSGEIRVGDRVRCLPGDQMFRIRSLQVHNDSVDVVSRGQRVAMNLAGAEKSTVERGQVICDERITMTSDRFDATLEIRRTANVRVKHHQRVRVHLGTTERLGTVILLDGVESVGPGESVFCQITTHDALLCLRGDHFVIRNETAERTLGGGRVLHPWAPRHRRREAGLADRMKVLSGNDEAALADLFLNESDQFAQPLPPLAQFLNCREEAAGALLTRLETGRALNLEGEVVYTTASKWMRVERAIVEELGRWHAAHPLSPGIEMEAAREGLPERVPARQFRAVADALAVQGIIARDGSTLRLPGHRIRLQADEQGLRDRIRELLAVTPLSPPDVKQIERDTGATREKLGDVLRVMERERTIVRVAPDLYFLGDCIDRLKADLSRHLSERSDITPATFRDLFGTTRKYAIPLLEYLDREGVTVRVGDARRLKRAS